MYEDPLLRRRRGPSWRFVLVVMMILGGVALLVICSRRLEEERPVDTPSTRRRGFVHTGGKSDPLAPGGDEALFSQAHTIGAIPPRPSTLSRRIWRRVQAMESDLVATRRKLHRHPELANREVKTAAAIVAALKSLGIEVKQRVTGTGVVALIRGKRPGPVVAARAVIDGVAVAEKSGLEFASTRTSRFMGRVVPVSHAAGHDLEITVLLGVAEILADLRPRLSGAVKLIFQPASEGPPPGERGGANAMIADGVLAAPSVSALFALKMQPALRVGEIAIDTSSGGGGIVKFAIHLRTPANTTCRRPGPRCPDLIATAAQLVLALRNIPHTRMDAAGRLMVTVGAIHGGKSGEVLPAHLEIQGTIRWRRAVDRNLAMHLVRRTALSSASLAGARSTLTYEHAGALVGNNPRLARWSLRTAVRVLRRSGIKIAAIPPLTDPGFDRFRRRVPSLLIQLGVTPRGGKPTSIRTPSFRADEQSIAVGTHLLTNLLVDYLLSSSGERRPARGPRGLPRAPRETTPARSGK